MKKLGIALSLTVLMACQNEKKTETVGHPITIDTLTFKYDSVKVYSKTPSTDAKATDTSKAVIRYPVFSEEKINQFIEQKILKSTDIGDHYKSYKDYATGFIKGYDNFQDKNKDRIQIWFLDIKAEVTKQKPNYLPLLITYVNFSGGAHPSSVFTYLNYDPVIHQEIVLDSLILPGTMPKLTAVAETIFRKNENLAPNASLRTSYFFENSTFRLNNNFTITDEGLKFLYNPYEIKPYVFGTTALTIPFSQLKGIAKPNSLLSQAH